MSDSGIRRGGYKPGPRNPVGWDRPIMPAWDLVPRLGINYPTQAHWSTEAPDESGIPVLHGHKVENIQTLHGPEFYKMKGRKPLAERQADHLPLFVLVRDPKRHDLFFIRATTTGARVSGAKPLPAAKLALATMRSAFAKMGSVTA